MEEIEYVFGTITLYCDNEECKCEYNWDNAIDNYPDIEEACKDAKEYGWEIFQEDNQWYHYCSTECKELDE